VLRAIDIFMDGNWAGAGVLSESGRIERCNAVLGSVGDLDETVDVCEQIETAIAQDCRDHHVKFAGHIYMWSLGQSGA
jgi:hypothetical protein